MVFDHYLGRPDIIGSAGNVRWVGHIGINMGGATFCLFHNIDFKGKYFHDFDIINVPSNCVVSNVKGTNMSLHHHGQGANRNLYTNVDVGVGDRSLGGLKDSQRQSDETHWGIYGDMTLDPDTVPLDTIRNHVFVGYDAGIATTITDTLWYEAIDPAQLHPKNIYLAQMEFRGKPLPEDPPPARPTQPGGEVVRINPVDDNTVSASAPGSVQDPSSKTISATGISYLKFDLSGLDLATVARARLRVSSTVFQNTPIALSVSSVGDDSWAEETITHNNRPAAIAELDAITINEDSRAKQLEFDVTPFVQAEWAGDKVVSLVIAKTSGNGFLSAFRSSDDGLAPELILEQVESPVPGAPAAPTGMKSFSIIGNIRLDWPDNAESDVVSYNVFRRTSASDFSDYPEPIATGLVTSDFVDIDSVGDWAVGMMRSDLTYFYRVTAVDSHGYESAGSTEFVGTTLDPENSSPAFTADSFALSHAAAGVAYTGSLAGLASDPEGDQKFFFKIDGPDWLTIGYDGTLSGTPQLSDAGINRFTVQVNTFGGRDEAVVEVLVDAGTVEPGRPSMPEALVVRAGEGAVFLDWADSTDADFKNYRLYRSTQSGSFGTALAEELIASDFLDLTVENGVTYYYSLRALDTTGLLSLSSVEVVATPSPDNVGAVADFGFDSRVLTSSDGDEESTATALSEGGGLTIGFESRGFGLRGNPIPSLKWANANASDGTVLDDDFLAFTVSADSGEIRFHSLSFDDLGEGGYVRLFTSQNGFATMDAELSAPRKVASAGGLNTHTLLLDDLSEVAEGSSTEFRLYIDKSTTSGESWIDNIRLTRLLDPGTPAFLETAPTGLAATAVGAEIHLDWDDHPGPDLASYNIHRATESGSYGPPIFAGILNSSYADNTAVGGTRYYYTVSAVSTVGGEESARSAEATVMANSPTPKFLSHPIEKPNAAVGRPYDGSLVDQVNGGAGLSFAKLSGPGWLAVTDSGQLSGRPATGDVGVNTWTVEVSDGSGGSDQGALQIVVSLTADFDSDGIGDNWELLHFGSRNAIDGSLDSDGDGVRDFFEYLYGSDPNKAGGDGFRLRIAPGLAGTEPVIDWTIREGFDLGMDYDVRISTDLESWDLLPEQHFTLEETTTSGMTLMELFLTQDYGERVFLRLGKP
jgi:fibronectin type 3 domain-containing protein